MKRKKLMSALAIAAAGALLLGAVPAQAAKKNIVGFVGLGNDPYWISLMCGADKAAAKDGVKITWYSQTEATVKAEQANLDAAMLKSPDGILFNPADPKAFSDQVAGFMKSGIPVQAINAPLNGNPVIGTVQSATDNSAFVDYVTKTIGKTGKIAVFGGIPGDIPVLTGRWMPIVASIKAAAPGIKILDTQYDGFDRAKTTQMAAAVITANPDLSAIYAVSGPEGEGVAAAVQEAGLTGKVKVYSYDATPGEVAALKAGTVTGLLAQGPGLIGAQGYTNLAKALKTAKKGKSIPTSGNNVEVPLKVLTKANLSQPASKPYIYAAKCN